MYNISITACDNITMRDLMKLHQTGHCVYRTSHAGNWSLYKLLLSELGIPDCIWDATCIHRDVNNQPRYQFLGGERLSLMGDVLAPDQNGTKYLTAYQRVVNSPLGLGQFHVDPLKKLFGEQVITSQSRALLEYRENLQIIFEVIERYIPEKLGRYVLPCGCMVPISEKGRARCTHHSVSVRKKKLADSAIQTLEELNRLLWDSSGYAPKGGVLYSFELVVASFYLWSYWKFGDKPIYQLSGPDMIGYATKPDFVAKIREVFDVLVKHGPTNLLPQATDARIVPTTVFRFGYPKGNLKAEQVMLAHKKILDIQKAKRESKHLPEVVASYNNALREPLEIVEKEKMYWDLFHRTNTDCFYSQHDMSAQGHRMQIIEEYLDMPFSTLARILHDLPQTERGLRRSILSKTEH